MIRKENLYELPWSRDDNPNGWIEPTTYCQLKCPLCYRGADLDCHRPEHVPLAEVKKDVESLIRLRRVATVTIAGGEPLMYPHLDETIDYIRSRGVEVMVLTNGVALDEAMIRRLKARGVARVVVHIDRHQGRPGVRTEEDTIPIRRAICDLFRKVGGVSLGFIQPIGIDDLDDLDVLIPFYKESADVVDLVTFNRMQPVVDFGSLPGERVLSAAALFERVRKVYGIEYGACLGRTHSEGISWLFGQAVFEGNHLIGSLDKAAFRFFQRDHYRRTGRYLHCTRDRHVTLKLLLYLPFNRSLRGILLRRLGVGARLNGYRTLNRQLVLIVNTPVRLQSGELDRCRGCPDAMMYDGRLVPSCLLERVKAGEMLEAG